MDGFITITDKKMSQNLLSLLAQYIIEISIASYLEYEPDDAENCVCPMSFCT